MPISLEQRGLMEARAEVDRVVRDLHGEPFRQAMRQATLIVEAGAKRYAPVDTGRLRASITSEVRLENNAVLGVVGSNVVYAPYMELGTGTYVGRPRYFPPPAALETWAKRHGFASGYMVARAIYKAGGLKPRRFLQRAFEENKARIVQIIGDGVKGIVR